MPIALWFPTTILFLVIITLIGLLTKDQTAHNHRELIERFGFDYADLRNGHVGHLLTGTWIQSEPGIELSMILMVASAAAMLEFLAGSIRTFLVMIAGDWSSTILTAITLRVLSSFGNERATALLTHADAGTSVAAHTAWAVAAFILPKPIGSIVYGLLLLVAISQFWWQGLAPAIAHLFGVLAGGAIGWWFLRSSKPVPETPGQ